MTLLSRGNGGNMNRNLTCKSCDRASINSALKAPGLETQTGEDACCGLWQACMSSVGVPYFPKIWVTISGWSLHSVVMGWFSRDRWSTRPIMFRQPGMCLAGWLCLEFVAIGTDPLLDITGYGNGSHPVC